MVLLKVTCIIRIFLLLAFTSLTLSATASSSTIVCTIKPACLLVNAIVGKQMKTTQLLPDNIDLHHYSFRPSDLRKLSQTAIVVYVSPTLEQFITPLLNPNTQTIITLADSPTLTFLPMPKKHQHSHHERHERHEKHMEHVKHKRGHNITTSQDPHFWLNPNNAIKIAQYLTVELIKIDPTHAPFYQKNSQKLIEDIKKTDQNIRQLLRNDQHEPYLMFHVSFQYFAKHYGLETPEIINLYEDLPLGIKSMHHLRQLIKTTEIRCLVSQPTASEALTKVLTEGTSINITLLDPVGSTLPVTHNHYTDLLYNIAHRLHDCLTTYKQISQ
ncbi:MAG TPA: hypothetical protein ENJ33_02410 [Thiothrix sp.]|nr:hypothetical protein [Thiothrix sp.]